MGDNPFHDSLSVSSSTTPSHSIQLSLPLQHGHPHSHLLSLPHPHPLSLSHPPPGHLHPLSHTQQHLLGHLPHEGVLHHSLETHQPHGNDLTVVTALRQMSEPSEVYSDLVHMPISKRLVEEVLASTSHFDDDLNPDGSPDRKRRKTNGEQQIKRHKYDVLKAFFRLYFEVDKESMVLKDAIYNLYSRKITNEARIARNAMYRHMRSFFKDKTTTFQSNYREYVKGIKLVMAQTQINYEGFEKDMELLTSIGVTELFDFQEEELAKADKNSEKFALSSQYLSNEESLLNWIEQLETVHRNMGNMLKELKNRIKKKS